MHFKLGEAALHTQRFFFTLIAIFLALHACQTSAAPFNNIDQSNLISAIEDYRFSDYESAIPTLERLHQKDPNHLTTLQYLALSYQESEKAEKAASTFKAWLKTNQYDTSASSRFAWMGLANAYLSMGEFDKAKTALSTWLKANPDDIQAQITLGDILVKQNAYAEANKIWNTILDSAKATSSDKAAAWYYKAWMAYNDQEVEQVKHFADKSLQADAEGAYANAAKQLQAAPSRQRLGFNGFAALEAFYNSNVKLIPENLTSTQWGGDKGIQGTLVLGWGLPNVALNYIFFGNIHEDYNDYDLSSHIISASWKKDKYWKFKPFYEYISLGGDKLYQSLGTDIYYAQSEWTYAYTLKLKSFSNTYGSNAVNLTRLGGSSHTFRATTKIKTTSLTFTVSPYLIAELTKGDATHNNSDSYYQLGGDASTKVTWTKGWDTHFKLALYTRLYAAADTNILLDSTSTTKRHDNYVKVSADTSWQPWDNYNTAFVLNLSYLKNTSNYNDGLVIPAASKSYSAWRGGISVTGYW